MKPSILLFSTTGHVLSTASEQVSDDVKAETANNANIATFIEAANIFKNLVQSYRAEKIALGAIFLLARGHRTKHQNNHVSTPSSS